jgi:probable rRNA maturation factor
VTLAVEVSRAPRVTGVPSARLLGRWAAAAAGRRGTRAVVSLRVVGPIEGRRLNRDYRGRDYATNVLSFPAGSLPAIEPRPLGDLVVCASVVAREAREQHKPVRAHWAHLVVHGVLHLLGHDHEDDADALRMERREIAVLRALGFANPYRVTARV